MSWIVFGLFNWVDQSFSSFREYISESTENTAHDSGVAEEVKDDHGVVNRRGSRVMDDEKAFTVSDGKPPVISINLQSNSGTVVIGDNPRITVDNLPLNGGGPNGIKKDLQIVSLGNMENVKGKRRRKRKPAKIDPAPLKTTAVVTRFNEIQKSLLEYRGNGKWNDHSNAVQQFSNQFRHDEHNADIIPLLIYEEAAALCDKNKTEEAKDCVVELGKKLKVKSNWELMNDNQKMISCRCLFLTSKLYCAKKMFGRAQQALDLAEDLLLQYDSPDIKAELFLTKACYQFCWNRTPDCAEHVTEFINEAENISAKLKSGDQENWKRIRREILLVICKAIIQFYLDGGDKKKFDEVLNNALGELENQLWDFITLRQKVDFHILKTNYFKINGNSARALDHARIALPIAQECQFTKEVSWLNEHISKLQIFPEDPANDSEGLVKTVSEIQTTTDGNLESNAAEITDLGIFSSDESEWETFDRQNRCLPAILKNEDKGENAPIVQEV